jgi:hypothetical protein
MICYEKLPLIIEVIKESIEDINEKVSWNRAMMLV